MISNDIRQFEEELYKQTKYCDSSNDALFISRVARMKVEDAIIEYFDFATSLGHASNKWAKYFKLFRILEKTLNRVQSGSYWHTEVTIDNLKKLEQETILFVNGNLNNLYEFNDEIEMLFKLQVLEQIEKRSK